MMIPYLGMFFSNIFLQRFFPTNALA